MLRRITLVIGFAVPSVLVCGQLDSPVKNSALTSNTKMIQKPELFNSGFIDFQNSAQMNASARIFKLFIGEPGKFSVPISLYSGVSAPGMNSGTIGPRTSEQMVLSLINPMSGLFNIYIDKLFEEKNRNRLTGIALVAQFGEKVLNGFQAVNLKNFNYFSTYGNIGMLFKTGAWEKNKEKNMGIFWAVIRYHFIKTANSFLSLSGYAPNTSEFQGYSLGIGIEINNSLNLKTFYYRYLKSQAAIFDIPIFQITFNYSLKN
jgi:hypothetical protein